MAVMLEEKKVHFIKNHGVLIAASSLADTTRVRLPAQMGFSNAAPDSDNQRRNRTYERRTR
ncbi:MAG: hypothetical protein R8G34_05760 [Paracoccaceae bacterium]|nr:hypothetical protein [Paracoccaceae bacterium]